MRVSAHQRFTRFLPLIILILTISACTLPAQESGEDTNNDEITGAPIVQIASPLPNASYLEGVAVPIQISVTNAGEDISRVDFSVDNTIIASPQNPNQAGALLFSLTQTWTAMGVGQHQISVTAFRADGAVSTPALVQINVVDETALSDTVPSTDVPVPTTDGNATNDDNDTNADSQQAATPTNTVTPTNPPAPTDPPAEPTSDVPTGTVSTGVNIRGGPGTNFSVVATITANQSVEVVGLNTGAELWYKVVYNDVGSEGWILGSLLSITGDTSDLPREAGPPTPVPPPPTAVPATAVPATAVPQTSVNLVAQNQFITNLADSTSQPRCNQSVQFGFSIRNASTGASDTGVARIQIVHVASGQIIRDSGDSLISVNLQPDGTHTISADFTIDVFVNEQLRAEFIADVNNAVAEGNENDNKLEITFDLVCP